jgi:hypothetical protein
MYNRLEAHFLFSNKVVKCLNRNNGQFLGAGYAFPLYNWNNAQQSIVNNLKVSKPKTIVVNK